MAAHGASSASRRRRIIAHRASRSHGGRHHRANFWRGFFFVKAKERLGVLAASA